MYTVITGATSGIGKALAMCYGANHHNLILVGRDEDALAALCHKLRKRYQIDVIGCRVDLCNEKALLRWVKWLKANGIQIECLINNAGIGAFGLFHETSTQVYKDIIQTNIKSLTILTKELLPLMAYKGHIIQVASTAAYGPGPYMSVYYASKAYVLSLSLALRCELKGLGIDVTVLCPGPTDTAFQMRSQMKKHSAIKVFTMSAKDVARITYKKQSRRPAVIIPGLTNQMAVLALSQLPMSLRAQMVSLTQQKR